MAPLKRMRHELLLREYIATGGNGAEAYRRAAARFDWGVQNAKYEGTRPKRLKHWNSATKCASRILSLPEVQARYRELQEQMAKKADITIDKILTDYQQALALAKEQGRPDSIVNAATAQAKLVGLLRDRTEVGAPGDFEDMDNISDVLQAVADQAGPDAALALANAFGIKQAEPEPIESEKEQRPQEAIEADLGAIKPVSDALN